MKAGLKAKVTSRAVIQRINRKLAPDMEKLRTTRGERMQLEVGRYHVVDFGRNIITGVNIDPEEMARALGVLEDYEEMVED